jgi:hypothetical protein
LEKIDTADISFQNDAFEMKMPEAPIQYESSEKEEEEEEGVVLVRQLTFEEDDPLHRLSI